MTLYVQDQDHFVAVSCKQCFLAAVNLKRDLTSHRYSFATPYSWGIKRGRGVGLFFANLIQQALHSNLTFKFERIFEEFHGKKSTFPLMFSENCQ